MKKHIFKIALCLGLWGFSVTSCDFLNVDRYIDDNTNLDSVFSRKILLDQYIKGAAAFLNDESRLYTNAPDPFQIASDENFVAWNDARHAGTKYLRDELNEFTGEFARWIEFYKGIRKANVVIKRINECQDISEIDRRDYAGKAYFLRGYYYYLLVRQYGPVPIVPDDPFETDESLENLSLERNTFDECCDYICESMEMASQMLLQRRSSLSEIYQPTKGAALAVISRVRLMQASPWFNGNAAYSGWKTSDGRDFISQTYDPDRWGKAALASKQVIDMGVYRLHTVPKNKKTPELPANVSKENFPDGAGNIDPLHSYSDMFNGETQIQSNDEFIFSCDTWRGADECVNWIVMPQAMGGANGLSLTQSLVDAYYMVDGHDIHNSSAEYPYPGPDEAWKEVGTDSEALLEFSDYEIMPRTAKMFVNREARFYATIGYCHCFWAGSSYLGTEVNFKNIEATYYKDGTVQPNVSFPDDKCFSGYTLKKYTHPEDNQKGTNRAKAFPIIRYAEILLNYAEALNEMDGTYTDPESGATITRDPAEICKAFNQIRYRAGLPGITEAEANNREAMRDLIKRERQIEFACEHMRFFDLRRWGDAMEMLNKPIMGMNVEAKSNERQLFYTPTIINYKYARRSFSFKMNFFPVHQNSINKNPKLVQNPGW